MTDVCEICSKFKAEHANLKWIDTLELSARAYLDASPKRKGASHLKQVIRFAILARAAIDAQDARGAAFATLGLMQAAWQAEIKEGRAMIDFGVRAYRQINKENERRAEDAEAKRQHWREEAARLWAMPELAGKSKTDIAFMIDPKRWNTIRRYI